MREKRYCEEVAISIMKQVIVNLSEWMNCPDEHLENMMGISWMQFWDLYWSIGGEALED
tara:strand:- start:250 stop:426 length:177 start_codon:yes stop_codon:yes gene_type:complete